jgi:UDP-N-acetylmuramate: L-alanyl-gamma-D-glutamyl-meso-diaminopimelate ligase
MSDLLAAQGVAMTEGYHREGIPEDTELVIVGNALSRGNPSVEHVLDAGLPYTSGPEWLSRHVLAGRHVLAVAGTHGKTTTASMLAHVLDRSGLQPGFLIGGMPGSFDVSARLGAGRSFVIEADEYDTAFFDKRSKFVHYRPRTLVLNNLEYDHADIFDDLAAIQRQFHHVVRIVPRSGTVICNAEDTALAEVLALGCWSPVVGFGAENGDWRYRLVDSAGTRVRICHGDEAETLAWRLFGRHNAANATAAIASAATVGVSAQAAVEALESFRAPRRRQEHVGQRRGIDIIDDFAHHPTAIAETLAAIAAAHPGRRILAAIELRSNSMRMGAHAHGLGGALDDASRSWVLCREGLAFDEAALAGHADVAVTSTVETLLHGMADEARAGDVLVFMSNGAFDDAPRRLLKALEAT